MEIIVMLYADLPPDELPAYRRSLRSGWFTAGATPRRAGIGGAGAAR